MSSESIKKAIFPVSLLVLCVIIIIQVLENEKKTPSASSDSYSERSVNEERTSSSRHQTIHYPVNTEEDQLINEIDKGDYYDVADYHYGLDGEYSDIDFEEVRDYFED